MITFYGLTDKGIGVAKNPRNPDAAPYRIMSFLYRVPKAETSLIADGSNLTISQTATTLKDLVAKGYVARE